MSLNPIVASKGVYLTDRDRQSTQKSISADRIQPHGCLLVLQDPELTIVQVSHNAAVYLGRSPADLLHRSIVDLLGVAQTELLHQFLQNPESLNPLRLAIDRPQGRAWYDGILHRSPAGLLLELEPTPDQPVDLLQFYRLVQSQIHRLQHASLTQICEFAVTQMRRITGFDRVTVYQLNWAGSTGRFATTLKAISADSDISDWETGDRAMQNAPMQLSPQMFSELYQTWLITDLTAASVPLMPAVNPFTDRPTDLSGAVLRSPPPGFPLYQDSGAWMSVPLLLQKQIWGLIICQHSEPRSLSYLTRTACEFLAQAVSSELDSREADRMQQQIEELTQRNRELSRSNQELDAFAYIASHDLKEPLRGIHNYADFLIEDYSAVLDEAGVAKLQTLMRLTQRMEDLIDSLLHFSRLGQVEDRQPVNLNELVLNAIEVSRLSRSDVKIRMPRSLPTVHCDPVQVSEVFSNLISNAIKYNDAAEKWVEISWIESSELPRSTAELILGEPIHSQRSEQSSEPVFYVRDNGIGIPDHHQEVIFRIFKRLHSNQSYGGGTGAGLTIARKIVERHGGRIWVESESGKGSTFYFTLQP